VLAAPVAAVATVAALAVSGAAAPSVLADPGDVVRWGLPVVTVLRALATALTLGALVLVAGVLPPGRTARSAPVVAAGAGSAWAVLGVVHLVLSYASITGRPIGGEAFGAELWVFLSEVAL